MFPQRQRTQLHQKDFLYLLVITIFGSICAFFVITKANNTVIYLDSVSQFNAINQK